MSRTIRVLLAEDQSMVLGALIGRPSLSGPSDEHMFCFSLTAG